MGYAQTLPSGLMRIGSGGIGSNTCTITTVSTNISLGTLHTPNYKAPLSSAYVDLVFQSRADTSGASNWFLIAGTNGHLGMIKGGGATFDCGAIHLGAFYTPASTFVGGEYRLSGTTNIASNLEPNTDYTCQIMHAVCVGDSLVLYGITFELNLFFGV